MQYSMKAVDIRQRFMLERILSAISRRRLELM